MEEIGVEIPRTVQRVAALDRRVAELDPLGADYFFRGDGDFRSWNDSGNVWLIAWEASRFIDRLHSRAMSFEELLAAKRDLAMIAAAIFRHLPPSFEPGSWNPLNTVPGLETALLWLAEQINEPPPLTTSDYCSRNPDGWRERRFTVGTDSKEPLFIDSVRRSIRWQMRALYWLVQALEISATKGLKDPLYKRLMERALWNFDHVVTIAGNVYQEITERIFQDFIRPYFNPQLIGGRKWPTASAAQSTMLELDLVAWMVGSRRTMAWNHFRSNLPFQAAVMRELTVQLRRRGSLVGNARTEVERAPAVLRDPVALESLRMLEHFMSSIMRFSGPHGGVVKKNTDYRKARGMHTKGSGGEDAQVVVRLHAIRGKQRTLVRGWVEAGKTAPSSLRAD